jgi:hypothetical protein
MAQPFTTIDELRQHALDLLDELSEEQMRLLLAYAGRMRDEHRAQDVLAGLLEERTA